MERDRSAGRAIGAVIALLLALAPAIARADTGLVATLSGGPLPGEIAFRLANTGPRPLAVLPAGTPLEPELSADVFRVIRSTKRWPPFERAVYRGRRVKRVPPSAADFVTLAPGQAVTAVVALERYYAVGRAGEYRVVFDGEIALIDPEALRERARGSSPVASERVRLRVAGPTLRLVPGTTTARARPAAFAGCDGPRRAALTETTAAAERLVADALAALAARDGPALASAPRYTHWFGPWAPGPAARVREVLATLLDSLSGATLTYDCGCADPTLYAYVYPTLLHDVFVCPAFFRAALLGADSRAGTLVHELSHFPSIAGTRDHVYGQSAVAGLALREPGLALDNADSYEYFVENDPFLPMEGGEALLAADRPPDDDPAAAFVPLPVDAVVTGALEAGHLARFATSGARAVSVDSLGGDADLYVFDDVALDAIVCASTTLERSGATETCPLLADGRTAYVVVHAYTDTRYAIRASGPRAQPIVVAGDPEARVAAGPGSSGSPEGAVASGLGGGGAGGGGAPGALALLALSALSARRRARP